MMKETFARQLGGQLGRFIKYLGYMCVWINFPLAKAPVPDLKVMIKGKGLMKIDVKYKNVPHFCFSCGRLGHATQNCDDGESDTYSGHQLWRRAKGAPAKTGEGDHNTAGSSTGGEASL
jgi:hypothetical protein